MKHFLAFPIALALFAAPAAHAQDWEFGVPGVSAFAEAQCNGSQVLLSIDLTIYDTIPSVFQGWVVKREVVGACVDDAVVSPVLPFPASSQQFLIPDEPDVPLRNTLYTIWGVEDDGDHVFILWPQRTMFAQADCVGGPIARGVVKRLFDDSPIFRLEVCPDQCWWDLSYFDGFLPPETAAFEGQVIDVFGPMSAGMEGPFVTVESWTPNPNSCDVEIVATERRSWGSMKGLYR